LNTFYTNSQLQTGQTIDLSKEESIHALRVLRLQLGDKVLLANGMGQRANCSIAVAAKKQCSLLVHEIKEKTQANKLYLLFAPPRIKSRLDWLIEKATELGAAELIPVFTEHSEKRNFNSERLNKIAIAAMKQSGRFFLPKIHEINSFNKAISNLKSANPEIQSYIAFCGSKFDRISLNKMQPKQDSIICIGPEGDFSEKEVEFAVNLNCKVCHLGSEILRVETAVLKACSVFNFINEE